MAIIPSCLPQVYLRNTQCIIHYLHTVKKRDTNYYYRNKENIIPLVKNSCNTYNSNIGKEHFIEAAMPFDKCCTLSQILSS